MVWDFTFHNYLLFITDTALVGTDAENHYFLPSDPIWPEA